MNWYVERVEAPAAPTSVLLLPTPGASPFLTTTDVGTRALFSMAGRTFAVIGSGFHELFATATTTRHGSVAQDNFPATISYNGTSGGQLFITSGGNGYLFVLATNTLSTIGALAGKATMGGMKDGYFLSFSLTNSTVYLSALNDGSSWTTGTDFFQRSIAPDPWKAMVVGNPEIWLIGEQTSEAWYDANASENQPFAPILSSFMQAGTNAPFSVEMAGAAPAFLRHDSSGSATIVRVQGYTPRALSNYAVNTALSVFDRAGQLDDCETLIYQQEGHVFACVNFATANATWAVDLDTGEWHERGSWNSPQNRYDVWHPRVHCHAFGRHLVGERGTGVISQLDVTTGTEADGSAIRRVRIPPPLWAEPQRRLFLSYFELQMDTGLGVLTGQGSAPEVTLRTSYDTRTWGSERSASAGAMGQYGERPCWYQCGSSEKAWVPQIVVSDPVPYRLLAASFEGSGMRQTRAA